MHIIIRYFRDGVGLIEEAKSLFDFSDYLLFFYLFLDSDLCLKVVAPLKGLNYIYKLLYQQLLIFILIRHGNILFINDHYVWVKIWSDIVVYLFVAFHHLTVKFGGPSGVSFDVEEHEEGWFDLLVDELLVFLF